MQPNNQPPRLQDVKPGSALSQAFYYTGMGFKVLPIHWINPKNGQCSCGNATGGCKPGKHPLTPHGKDDASSEPDVIKAWWAKWPNANIAIKVDDFITVLDIDFRRGGQESLRLFESKYGSLPPTVKVLTGSGDGSNHLWFRVPNSAVELSNLGIVANLPGVELKVKGYVLAPGSITTTAYTFAPGASPEDVAIAELPECLIQLSQAPFDGDKKHDTIECESAQIPEGQRNDTLASLGGAMRRRGIAESAITAALLEANREQCKPPLPEGEVRAIAKSMARYSPYAKTYTANSPHNPPGIYSNNYIYMPGNGRTNSERDKSVTDSVTNLSDLIEHFVTESSGWFSYEDIDREFGINSPKDKDNRRQIMKRLKDGGKIEAHPKINKLFRFINTKIRLIDFKSAGIRKPLTIKYPFEIEKYFQTYPGNVIAIAGAADSGKTAWLLNFIRQNQEDFSIFYQSSEMGKEELASRLQNFEDISLEEWNFTAEERSRDFADVIRPDCVNIIDYLELSGDFYNVGEYLREIHDRLADGICIVALQKKRGADLGRGGDFGLEKPRLYLSMDIGKCTIQKAKNWVDHTLNPNGLVIRYKIVGGCRFIITEDWRKP